jgi:hypothetical protein
MGRAFWSSGAAAFLESKMMQDVHWDILMWRLDTPVSGSQAFASIRRAVSLGMNRGTARFRKGKDVRRLEWRLLGDRVEVRLSREQGWSFLDPSLYAVLFSHGVQGERVYWALAKPPTLPRRRVRLRAGGLADQIEVLVPDNSDEE